MASNVILFRKTAEAKAAVQSVTDDVVAYLKARQVAQDEAYERTVQIEDAIKSIEQQARILFALSDSVKLAEQRAHGAIGRALMRAQGSCGND
jgi:hypothetical protein